VTSPLLLNLLPKLFVLLPESLVLGFRLASFLVLVNHIATRSAGSSAYHRALTTP
jgi:hypothetical protein